MASTTEITSAEIASDNPIHQRLAYAYEEAANFVEGDLLELGCGVGRGIEILKSKVKTYTAVDKIEELTNKLSKQHPEVKFIAQNIPPLSNLEDNSFDWVVTFQVIEHIQKDELFLKEISRVLKPGGKALITTPNLEMSFTRNPWHVREYKPQDLTRISKKYFSQVEMKGVYGNEKVMAYYESNRKSVDKIAKWDILNMQWWLPASILRVPYEILNRRNRKKLMDADLTLVKDIKSTDYLVENNSDKCLDLFMIATK